MIIDLSEEQKKLLELMNQECRQDFLDGRPGVIFAQVKVNRGEMVVRYIEHEMALKIQEIIGEQEVGKTC